MKHKHGAKIVPAPLTRFLTHYLQKKFTNNQPNRLHPNILPNPLLTYTRNSMHLDTVNGISLS